MEHGFFYNEKHFSDIAEFAEDMTEEEINQMKEDDTYQVSVAKEEPIFQLSVDWVVSRFEDRFTEDGDDYSQTRKILEDNIDFAKLNSLIPKLLYESREKMVITKQDLLETLYHLNQMKEKLTKTK